MTEGAPVVSHTPTELLATEQGLQIKGMINFSNAADIFRRGKQLLDAQQQALIMIDLAQLGASNTVALAVFVQWLRECQPKQCFKLINVPEKLQAIIKTSNLTEAFGLT